MPRKQSERAANPRRNFADIMLNSAKTKNPPSFRKADLSQLIKNQTIMYKQNRKRPKIKYL